MRNDERDFEPGDFPEIWSRAQHRRTEDIGKWLADFFGRSLRRIESNVGRSPHSQAAIRAPGIKTA